MSDPTRAERLAALRAQRDAADEPAEPTAAGPAKESRTRTVSKGRVAATGASLFSFGAMVAAMGPLAGATDNVSGSGGDPLGSTATSPADGAAAQPTPTAVGIEVVPTTNPDGSVVDPASAGDQALPGAGTPSGGADAATAGSSPAGQSAPASSGTASPAAGGAPAPTPAAPGAAAPAATAGAAPAPAPPPPVAPAPAPAPAPPPATTPPPTAPPQTAPPQTAPPPPSSGASG